jgi:hypothetical protein
MARRREKKRNRTRRKDSDNLFQAFFFSFFLARTSTASRIRIRAICDMVRSSCAAISSTSSRNSGSIRKVTWSVCLGLGPGFMPRH